jgi:hypothetical protein
VIHEKVRHAPRITAWVAISSNGLLRTIFFEDAMNSERYLSMLHSTVMPVLATDLLLYTQWFMQDGARPQTANVVFYFLHDPFNSCHLKLIS